MSTITLVMYSSTITFLRTHSSTHTQKVLVLEYKYEYMSTITPSLGNIIVLFVL